MTWQEQKYHTIDYYFCLINRKRAVKKNRHKSSYPSISSAIRPSLHSDEQPVSVVNGLSPSEEQGSDEEQNTDDETQELLTISDEPSYESSVTQQFSQSELNELVRDLSL